MTYQSSLSSPRDLYAARCNPKERFAIVLHGWKEDCSADWSQQLIKSMLIAHQFINFQLIILFPLPVLF